MDLIVYLGLFFPLAGFLILMAMSSILSRRTISWIGCGSIFLSLTSFVSLLYAYDQQELDFIKVTLFQWLHFGGLNADFALRIDALSLLMTLVITGVGFLIHVYSIGYMDHDEDYARYFSCMNFFVFMMLLLVLAANLLLLFVGWEGVGLASYLLIGYWYQRPAAAQAATKAFIVNRIGDAGLLVGLLLTFYLFGTSDVEEVSQKAAQAFQVGAPLLTLLTLLYFVGAVGKSAQLPLYVWLPDAMEGPTPVSALIHAATMVTAGVYLIVRMHAVFMMAPTTMYIVGIIGGVTSLFAALCALAQTDLKRVLAYSTVSQLGLMFLACGVGAFYAAMFHLTTHAFVKGLLFLTAGNVVHMMHGNTDMNKMGGLSKIFTKTHWLFLIGALALAGIPPLSAFFSKDLILEQEHIAGLDVLFYVGLIASIFTAFYMTRAYVLTFMGSSRQDEAERSQVKEAPKVMLLPELVLAVFAIFGGFLGYSLGQVPVLESFLDEADITLIQHKTSGNYIFSTVTLMSVIGGLSGVAVAAIVYTKYINKLGNPFNVLLNAFYVNEIYDYVLVRPLKGVAKFFANTFDPKIFDGAIQIAVNGTQGTAQCLQKLQNGEIRSYVALMVLGSVIVIVYLVL